MRNWFNNKTQSNEIASYIAVISMFLRLYKSHLKTFLNFITQLEDCAKDADKFKANTHFSMCIKKFFSYRGDEMRNLLH